MSACIWTTFETNLTYKLWHFHKFVAGNAFWFYLSFKSVLLVILLLSLTILLCFINSMFSCCLILYCIVHLYYLLRTTLHMWFLLVLDTCKSSFIISITHKAKNIWLNTLISRPPAQPNCTHIFPCIFNVWLLSLFESRLIFVIKPEKVSLFNEKTVFK